MKELATSKRNANGKHGTRLQRKVDDIAYRLALKEMRETLYWRRPILRAERIPDRLNELIDEAGPGDSRPDCLREYGAPANGADGRADCTFAFAFLLLVFLNNQGDFSGGSR